MEFGDIIIVQNVNPHGLVVRLQPSTKAQQVGGVFDGAVGTIDDEAPDPEVAEPGYTWWLIEWEDGQVGWSAEAGLDGTVYLVRKP